MGASKTYVARKSAVIMAGRRSRNTSASFKQRAWLFHADWWKKKRKNFESKNTSELFSVKYRVSQQVLDGMISNPYEIRIL